MKFDNLNKFFSANYNIVAPGLLLKHKNQAEGWLKETPLKGQDLIKHVRPHSTGFAAITSVPWMVGGEVF